MRRRSSRRTSAEVAGAMSNSIGKLFQDQAGGHSPLANPLADGFQQLGSHIQYLERPSPGCQCAQAGRLILKPKWRSAFQLSNLADIARLPRQDSSSAHLPNAADARIAAIAAAFLAPSAKVATPRASALPP